MSDACVSVSKLRENGFGSVPSCDSRAPYSHGSICAYHRATGGLMTNKRNSNLRGLWRITLSKNQWKVTGYQWPRCHWKIQWDPTGNSVKIYWKPVKLHWMTSATALRFPVAPGSLELAKSVGSVRDAVRCEDQRLCIRMVRTTHAGGSRVRETQSKRAQPQAWLTISSAEGLVGSDRWSHWGGRVWRRISDRSWVPEAAERLEPRLLISWFICSSWQLHRSRKTEFVCVDGHHACLASFFYTSFVLKLNPSRRSAIWWRSQDSYWAMTNVSTPSCVI